MKYDLAIIGGGPAGLMAACRAGELGAKVIVLEKNKKPGIKLLITGGGRANLTNIDNDPKDLSGRYMPNGRFLISAFNHFGPPEVIIFFNSIGVATKVENNGRVFPQSDRAADVLEALIKKIKTSGGEIRTGATVKTIVNTADQIKRLILDNGEEIIAENYLLATGGKSYPATGSDGSAYSWLKQLGHTIIKPRPALTPLYVREDFIKNLEGLSLGNITINIFNGPKKIAGVRGDIIFTSSGLSGPAALDASRFIDLESNGKFRLEIGLWPDATEKELNDGLQKMFHGGNKLLKNILEKMIAPRLASALMAQIEISSERLANSVTREERIRLVALLKGMPLSINGLGNFDQAMVTAGGVNLKEVDPKTLRSRLISNLYLAGEILDLTGPTGGFNLQLCWSTGYRAGESAIDKNIIL